MARRANAGPIVGDVNAGSTVASGRRRNSDGWPEPATDVKPPATSSPSAVGCTSRTGPPVISRSGTDASSVPSSWRTANPWRGWPPTDENHPPTITRPSGRRRAIST